MQSRVRGVHPDLQRIAIAQASGWKFENHSQGTRLIRPDGKIENNHYAEPWRVPDYCNSLDAMHEAEKMLVTDSHWHLYWNWLDTGPAGTEGRRKLLHSTAAQRAGAFLRTIGKWEEE